ncbi:MAG: hypothetical protein A2Z99_07575 [Treponema sp. GWB1_62_6]|nr:MAG: hypothetical protein A2Z99_07575 [Treponema sp. GWB1_62_6]OHE66448.1 MAG: hypothetical protein A2001_17545 [Treponema sp. GWC1_61_84]OHE66840.1 MAG: hypothetical protein A2Y36_10655 [Treponema sp. GWA1_62_8]OHE68480.1 MAG: hypothetical protein A2413_06680 [Treponema sp. RIFOXYC1_FULL_61_9]HCM29093.1 haloacid dehalogenase [Treponema sp.]
MDDPIDALLFDFGNVVVRIDFDRAFRSWGSLSGKPAEWFKERFSMDEAYERHERGQLTAEEYFAVLRTRFGTDLSDGQFALGWNAIFLDVIPGMVGLLERAKRDYPLFMFSNTNAEHQKFWMEKYSSVLPLFDRIFTSVDLGKRKPEAEAFSAVAEAIRVPRSRILFFDDAAENIDGARRAGLKAVHVRTIRDIEGALMTCSSDKAGGPPSAFA